LIVRRKIKNYGYLPSKYNGFFTFVFILTLY
jgi:hypothetical protein